MPAKAHYCLYVPVVPGWFQKHSEMNNQLMTQRLMFQIIPQVEVRQQWLYLIDKLSIQLKLNHMIDNIHPQQLDNKPLTDDIACPELFPNEWWLIFLLYPVQKRKKHTAVYIVFDEHCRSWHYWYVTKCFPMSLLLSHGIWDDHS